MEPKEWIAINYTLPREPSRVRVAVWRKLKKIGAVSIQQSMWILPANDKNSALLNNIKVEIARFGGEAFILKFTADDDGEKIMINRLNEARDEEYREFLEQCEDFFREIEKETARENFIYAEIEENEEELNKLKRWYEKIAVRDTFGSSLQDKAQSMLLKCAELLDGFCDKVYEFNDNTED